MCCTSRHPKSGFASKARATIAAAIGADADVPRDVLDTSGQS